MIIDEAEIYARAGKGGNGCVSFRREKFIPKGGPDGGDGGAGGSVYAIAESSVETLLDVAGHHHWIAKNGQPGMGKQMAGKGGEDVTLLLPVGTLLYDKETGVLLKDLAVPGLRVCLAQGGKGGRGNARFATATHQTPREAEAGTPGQERWLRLELKLIADVGLIGLPNAGKSTLLSRLSKARPKIADYPFTTLKPQLGIAELSGYRRFVIADIPGLIEGAHQGAGLGDAFLKHIERTRIIVHLVDVGCDSASQPPEEAYRTIREELAQYSQELVAKVEIIAASKTDLTGGEEAARALADSLGLEVLPISAVSGKGLSGLMERIWSVVQRAREGPATEPTRTMPPSPIPPHRKIV